MTLGCQAMGMFVFILQFVSCLIPRSLYKILLISFQLLKLEKRPRMWTTCGRSEAVMED